jgi:hypothetical protein
MRERVLSDANLKKIPRANIVDFILEGVTKIEIEIQLNELDKKVNEAWASGQRKIKVNNLIKLLTILVEECKHDPLTGRILHEAEPLIPILQKIKLQIESGKTAIVLGTWKGNPKELNNRLRKIIAHLEAWKKEMEGKLHIPRGNSHTHDTYHPAFSRTHEFKPNYLPDDYRSNFFFEVRIKELCPFLTSILYHPYSEVQRRYPEGRSIEQLTKININVDLQDEEAVEASDNIRAFRVHGPKDSKRYPGSYVIIRGGHHRTRAIYMKYLKGEVDGDLKILMQLVDPKDFPDKNVIATVLAEIPNRERLRKEL